MTRKKAGQFRPARSVSGDLVSVPSISHPGESGEAVYDPAGARTRLSALLAAAAVPVSVLVALAVFDSTRLFERARETVLVSIIPPEPTRRPLPDVPLKPAPEPAAPRLPAIEPPTVEIAMARSATSPPTVTSPVQATVPVEQATPTSRTEAVKPNAPSPAAADDRKSLFESRIRDLVEARKRYPTGRDVSLQKPEGAVDLCVTLRRDGDVTDVRIRRSSGSYILDGAGRRLLGSMQFPPFPEDFVPDAGTHAFCMVLDYRIPR